ncbi:MAG: WXG100 family type VII secretion target [Mycobacterium sp.]
MSDETELTPNELRGVARHLDSVSERYKDVLSKLVNKTSAEGAPWGGSKDGRTFANGAEGYLAQVDWVHGSVDAKTDLLDQYAKGINSTANNLEGTDRA